jgi:hypothetical protein
VLNSSGLKLYNSAGSNTVALNSADGSASFSGTIGSVDIVGYARVINPVTLAQMFMHPGASQYPGLYASVGYAAERGSGSLSLNGGQLLKDMIWFLETPRVSFANTPDPSTTYEVARSSVGILTNALLTSSDPTLWPTRIGGYWRVTVPYGCPAPAGWTLVTRPFLEFQHDLNPAAVTTPLTTSVDIGKEPGIWWTNKYGHNVGFRMVPGSTTITDVVIDAFKNNSNAYCAIRASAFTVSSWSGVKHSVRESTLNALDVIRANPPLEWAFDGETQMHLGPMADDLPEVLSPDGRGVDTTSMIGLLWKAIGELEARLEAAGVARA